MSSICGLIFFSIILAGNANASSSVKTYAAASLTQPINQIAKQYQAETGVKIITVFAASSTLARQIAQGAPADIYLSANQKWMNYLIQQQPATINQHQNLLQNALALVSPARSTLSAASTDSAASNTTAPAAQNQVKQPTSENDKKIAQLITSQLKMGQRLATGNTDHVPVGIYAKQSLTSLGLWQSVNRQLALSSNTRAALAFVERGAVPLGIVYKTDALSSDKVKLLATFSDNSHSPILYPMALINRNTSQQENGQPSHQPSAESLAFYQYLQSDKAAAIFTQFGFSLAPYAH